MPIYVYINQSVIFSRIRVSIYEIGVHNTHLHIYNHICIYELLCNVSFLTVVTFIFIRVFY